MTRRLRCALGLLAVLVAGLTTACSGSESTGMDLFTAAPGGCDALAACCLELSSAQEPACAHIVTANVTSECNTELAVFQSLGSCGGSSGTGTGSSGSSGTGASTATATDTAAATTLLLFGGFGPGHVELGDTWQWDGTTWADVASSGPSARDSSTMAALGGKLVLFGGGKIDQSQSQLEDTWLWNGVSWTPAANSGPFPRAGAVMAPLGGKLYLFGGYSDGDEDLSDTWMWDGVTWTELQITGPSARDSAVMAPFGDGLVLFGGGSLDQEESQLSDTWAFDGTAWAPVSTPNSPSARAGAVMAPFQGQSENQLVLFGGYWYGYEDLEDTWAWNGSTWEQLGVVGPSARDSAVMAPLGGKLVLFGGAQLESDASELADTWLFDGAAWAEVATTTSPSARGGAVMAAP